MYKNVRVEPDDLNDYATKKYDIEPEEADSWLNWILPDDSERSQVYALHELSNRTKDEEHGPDHPCTRAYTLLHDYMTDHDFAQITLIQ